MQSKNLKPKKQRRKKRAPGSAVSAVSAVPKAPILEKKYGPKNVTMIGSNFQTDITHYFDEMAPRIVGGRSIARYSGCMPVAVVREDPGSTSGSGIIAPLNGGAMTEVLHLNPLFTVPSNSPEANVAITFTKFRYTKLRVLYQGMRQANTNGQVVIGYYNDGSLTDGDVTTFSALYTPGSMITSLWVPLKSADVTRYLTGGDWFYIDYDNSVGSSDADYRLSFQGAIFGIWYVLTDTLPAIGASFNCGQIWLEYEVEFSGPRYAYDVALLTKLQPRVEDLIRNQKKRHRRKIEEARSGLEQLLAPDPALLDEEPDLIRVQLTSADRGSAKENKRSESKTRKL